MDEAKIHAYFPEMWPPIVTPRALKMCGRTCTVSLEAHYLGTVIQASLRGACT
uniref:Uncharacterized protein n=1 Tax=Arundo donax TaxID=35708 RepID=A0A0A9ASD1_ARUDO